MGPLTRSEILKLSIAERIELVGDIWDSVAEVPEAVELSDQEKVELERRLDAYHKDPDAGSPWPAVRERIRKRA